MPEALEFLRQAWKVFQPENYFVPGLVLWAISYAWLRRYVIEEESGDSFMPSRHAIATALEAAERKLWTWDRAYRQMLSVGLAGLDRWFGPPLSGRALRACLAIAALYTSGFLLLGWAMGGTGNPAGLNLLSDLSPAWRFATCGVCLIIGGWLARRYFIARNTIPWFDRWLTLCLLATLGVGIAIALVLLLETVAQLPHILTLGPGGQRWFLTAASIIASWLLAPTFAYAALRSATASPRRRVRVVIMVVLSVACFALGARVAFASIRGLGAAIMLLVFVLPCTNALLDWLSWYASRRLAGLILVQHAGGPRGIALVAAAITLDLALALVLVVGTADVTVAGVSAYNALARAYPTLLEPVTAGAYIVTATVNPQTDGLWAILMVTSTLVPTFLHFILAVAGALLGIVPNRALRSMARVLRQPRKQVTAIQLALTTAVLSFPVALCAWLVGASASHVPWVRTFTAKIGMETSYTALSTSELADNLLPGVELNSAAQNIPVVHRLDNSNYQFDRNVVPMLLTELDDYAALIANRAEGRALGQLVTYVPRSTVMNALGVRVGDIVSRIGKVQLLGQPNTASEVEPGLRLGNVLPIEIFRRGQSVELTCRLTGTLRKGRDRPEEVIRVGSFEFRFEREILLHAIELASQGSFGDAALAAAAEGDGIVIVRVGRGLRRFGLEDGDVLHSLDDHDLSDPLGVITSYAALRHESRVTLRLTRGGAPQQLHFALEGPAELHDAPDQRSFQLGENHFRVPRASARNFGLWRSARVVPEQKDGNVVGLRLFGIRPRSMLWSLGFQNGDRLERIAGQVIFDNSSLQRGIETLPDGKIELELMRRGRPLILYWTIVDKLIDGPLMETQIKPQGSHSFQVGAALRWLLLQEANTLFESARATVLRTGRQTRVVLSDIGAGGVLTHLGLQNGDAILAVNGFRYGDSISTLQASHALIAADSVELEIERGGARRGLQYAFEPSPD